MKKKIAKTVKNILLVFLQLILILPLSYLSRTIIDWYFQTFMCSSSPNWACMEGLLYSTLLWTVITTLVFSFLFWILVAFLRKKDKKIIIFTHLILSILIFLLRLLDLG